MELRQASSRPRETETDSPASGGTQGAQDTGRDMTDDSVKHSSTPNGPSITAQPTAWVHDTSTVRGCNSESPKARGCSLSLLQRCMTPSPENAWSAAVPAGSVSVTLSRPRSSDLQIGWFHPGRVIKIPCGRERLGYLESSMRSICKQRFDLDGSASHFARPECVSH